MPDINETMTKQRERVETTVPHIYEVVKEARDHCTSFNDFKERLASKDVTVRNDVNGELFYCEKHGPMIGATTFERALGLDVTPSWFESHGMSPEVGTNAPARRQEDVPHPSQSQPSSPQPAMAQPLPTRQTVTDGRYDTDGATPSLDDDIKSHDGLDPDVSTTQIEDSVASNGFYYGPDYTAKTEHDNGRFSAAGADTTGSKSIDRDISDHMQQVR